MNGTDGTDREPGDPAEDDASIAPAGRSPDTQNIAEVGPTHVLAPRFSVVVVGGPEAGLRHTSSGDRVVIGTHQSADMVLTDPTVSRFHCEVSLSQGRLAIRDLGSRNGTLFEGVNLVAAWARDGLTVALGNTTVRIEMESGLVKIPLSESDTFGLMVGRSSQMRAVFIVLACAAENDATVLIEGETGTGKELAAESIHQNSARRNEPFIVVDCGAIPPELLESELFGHERGAFTGAVAARAGAFEAARGGTIFLDEVGELSAALQPKLLRALESREIKRVGATKYMPIDVRIIAATNRDLREEVNAHRFRSDLYYRLAVLPVRLPPLRERVEDIPLVVERILFNFGAAERAEADALRAPQFIAELKQHPWRGNIRELRNHLERCLALRETLHPVAEPSPASESPPPLDVSKPLKVAREHWTRAFERQYVEEILRRHDGNVTAAARAAEVGRIYFYRLLWRYGLR